MLDALPIIADPLGRSFVTDDGVNSLLFFVVFFIHMIVPLAMGVVMWLHITRLARPRFLTRKPMTLWVTAMLLIICVAYPAKNEAPAMMTAIPAGITMDWWFLFPMPLIDRMSGGALWALFLVAGTGSLSIPWWLAKRRQPPATVVTSRCNECKKCYVDCPYDAIEMVTRSDGNSRYLSEASVITSKCVACGICAGSCDTMGIGLDSLSSIEQRRRIGAWLKQAEAEAETAHIAFLCAESAGAALDVDLTTGRCDELPGYRVLRVPCAGWVQPLMIERALRQGAGGVLVTSCGPDQCVYREGAEWERLRLEGTREPALRTDKIEKEKVQLIGVDRTQKAELIHAAARFRRGEGVQQETRRPTAHSIAAAALLAAACAGLMGMISDSGYAGPGIDGSELVISLKHPGTVSENCRDLTEEELAATPIHMRKAHVCERMRPPVRLRVTIDGITALETSIAPSGIWSDGNSVTVERIPVEPGDHLVSLAIGETADVDEWSFGSERTITFSDVARRVVVFDRVAGFTWH
jgi:coenzyme F420-reducing hydrogenase delta subunit/Pyruvate/2-oxoacid:ferredoxin oxidoreductase delta subunit